jgi:hypothetical protein
MAGGAWIWNTRQYHGYEKESGASMHNSSSCQALTCSPITAYPWLQG